MDQQAMIEIVDAHIRAEGRGDVAGACASYTDDVIHDAVGIPGSPRVGKAAAASFYEYLCATFLTERETEQRRWFADDMMFMEQAMTGKVVGDLAGIPGRGRSVSFRLFHAFQFRDGLICREQVWIDWLGVIEQLKAP